MDLCRPVHDTHEFVKTCARHSWICIDQCTTLVDWYRPVHSTHGFVYRPVHDTRGQWPLWVLYHVIPADQLHTLLLYGLMRRFREDRGGGVIKYVPWTFSLLRGVFVFASKIFIYKQLIKLCVKYLKENNAVSLYDQCGHVLAQKPLPLKVMKFARVVDPSIVIITILSLPDICSGIEKTSIFKEIHTFYTFNPKIISPFSGGHEICDFTSTSSTNASYQI